MVIELKMRARARTFNLKAIAGVVLGGILLAGHVTPAQADALNLVQNGSFEDAIGFNGQSSVANSSNLPGWQVSSCLSVCTNGPSNTYTFLLTPSYTTAGVYVPEYNAMMTFNGGGPGVSPDGGNSYAANANFQVASLSQTISGLTVGATYQLSFYQASTQLQGYNSPSSDAWQVSFGNQTQNSNTMNTPTDGYTGWVEDTMDFTATSVDQALSFLATSNSAPPFLLLDGVSLTQVPEPASYALVAVGLVGLMLARRKWRGRAA